MITFDELTASLTAPLEIPVLEDEEWYGGCVADGSQYPLTRESTYELDLIHLVNGNQVAPIFLSTKGRAIWSATPFKLTLADGVFHIVTRGAVSMVTGADGLRGAQQVVAEQAFQLGKMPPRAFFDLPQWNTWIELLYQQNQADVLKYAHGIADNGFPAGIIMIDDLWADYYGRWEFSARKFPDPRAMIDELHDMGFKVMVWVCPFVSADSMEYRELRDKQMLLREPSGEPVVREWWNGYSAVLDLSNSATYDWLKGTLQKLQADTGVDGFKFDAGDPQFYQETDISAGELSPQQQTQLWGEFGAEFPYNEFRANYRNEGAPLVNRLQDKRFEWGKDGLAELIPDTIAQGLLGYYFSCPDMIGGGEIRSLITLDHFDQELIVRSAQCSALMPMMQFSVAPWRVLDKEHLALCRQAAKLHQQFADNIATLAENAAQTGAPIVRSMAYNFAETKRQYLNTQFMLGNDFLVAPVLEQHATQKAIYFPAGQWQSITGEATIITGPAERQVPVTLQSLPAYRKLSSN
ncbi:hypothetical protein FC99_GL000277 [Levilactobacillus koreensis JCM 16448]|uniref:Glycoside hydrolase n=1 Tax=Levilactobacillus koreensis TaxID=637971 RepID=A0AAC8UUC5_9LACO|nr:glycoside hydrolase family 31 protein [Levilactobacillus koreensis]AKP64058.1 glycoside hydrolase [Levilactobacillus koreensis]KRK89661.1 hypothetical protein FC99_GL000277 [Levilactobacillus koreensis JCM 16448]